MIYPITAQWDVPLMPAHGFSSKSFCWSAAKAIEYQGKPTFIFYVGDYDPSGLFIDKDIEDKLRRYAPGADITFQRLAVLPEQVDEWKLPSKPPKKEDSRSKSFEGQAVEVEAIEPDALRQLLDDALKSVIDHGDYERMCTVEAAERETLAMMISGMEDATP
jgi:hypothetical protein